MGRGKSKGNNFERKVMHEVTKAFQCFGVTHTDAFRSILSGGHKESFGDISLSPALAKLFPFATECKFYKKVDLYQLMEPWEKMGNANKFKNWWVQTLEGAEKSKALYPLLIFKGNNKAVMCMIYKHHFYTVLDAYKNILRKKRIACIHAHHPDGDLMCFKFSVLLKLLTAKNKKGIKNGQVSNNQGSGIRLRPQDTTPRKQVPKSPRASRKANSNSVRTIADKRK